MFKGWLWFCINYQLEELTKRNEMIEMINKSSSRKYSISVILLGLLFLFQNCADVGYRKPPKQEKKIQQVEEVVTPPTLVPVPQFLNESFVLKGQAMPLDVLWVIDNSGSMKQEAGHVRQNISRFIDHIESFADVKVGLISEKGNSGTSVSLPSASNMFQVNRKVASRNAFRITASEVTNGQLKDFFREGASRIIIVVTDDKSDMSYSDFIAQIGGGAERPKVFSFSSFASKSESPCRANYSDVYFTAASETGGKVFNVCDSDWSGHFDTLAEEVIEFTDTKVTLNESQIDEILSVKINGELAESSSYTFDGVTVSLKSELLNDLEGDEINLEVKYKKTTYSYY